MQLRRHPESRPAAVASVGAFIEPAPPLLLRLRYRIRGEIAALRIPPPATPARRDGLWRTTCFEAFLAGAEDGGPYFELNFSPSGEWAAYRFDTYRAGCSHASLAAPAIETKCSPSQIELRVELAIPRGIAWRRIALTAVVQERDGAKSYWALAFPPGPPDFHHPACFAAELPPPARP